MLRKLLSLTLLFAGTTLIGAKPSVARDILISNDDGLTSNVVALQRKLEARGHRVIVSVPCRNQSGMGAAILFAKTLGELKEECLNGAAAIGDPGAGEMTRDGLPEGIYHYVDGTPVMALLYGLDVLAPAAWGKQPDLVISGPNEGQNPGPFTISSGTVSVARFAAIRGIPAIATSASFLTSDSGLANPSSRTAAERIDDLVEALDVLSQGAPMLPEHFMLNVNFPEKIEGASWAMSVLGSYSTHSVRFVPDLSIAASAEMKTYADARGVVIPAYPGLVFEPNTHAPSSAQLNDESLVFADRISVSPVVVMDGPAIPTAGGRESLVEALVARLNQGSQDSEE